MREEVEEIDKEDANEGDLITYKLQAKYNKNTVPF